MSASFGHAAFSVRRVLVALAAVALASAALPLTASAHKPPEDAVTQRSGPKALRAAPEALRPVAGSPTTAVGRDRNVCSASARSAWRIGGNAYTIDASARGPTCLTAVSTLVIRDAAGGAVWTDVVVNEQNFALQDATTPTKLAAALGQWIDQRDPTFATTAALPEWKAGDDLPAMGDFAFYVEGSYEDRAAYAAVRARAAPMICYVQGIESIACLALLDGGFERIGAQSFPG
jgi:hypothetical protein